MVRTTSLLQGLRKAQLLLWYPIVRYSYRPLAKTAVVISMSTHSYLFAVSNWSLFLLMEVCSRWLRCLSVFSRSLGLVAKRYILQEMYLKKWIGSALLGTRQFNFQPPTPTLSGSQRHNAQRHRRTGRQINGLTDDSIMTWLKPIILRAAVRSAVKFEATEQPTIQYYKKAVPCYRKDDRAMRSIYGCSEKFRETLATHTATFPEIINGLLL